MQQDQIRIVLVDDEQIALDRMKVLLKCFPDIKILDTTTNASKSIEIITELKPDMVFLDVEMPGKTGLEIAEELKRSCVFSKIIFVTSHSHYAIEALRNNAFDYILKPISIKVLKEVILRYKLKLNSNSNLSYRELAVLRLVAKGLSSKQIAKKLSISHHTVNTHRRNILHKTHCKNTVDLVRFVDTRKL